MTNPLLDPLARLLVGHRGTPARAPENSIEGFQQALSLGADAIEFDVRLTADGVPVVMHDPTLDRTTTGHGRLRERTLAELGALRILAPGASAGATQAGIPSLEQALDAMRDVPLVIEVKEAAAVEPTVRLVHRFAAHGRVVLGSSDAEASAQLYRSALPACASRADAVRLIPPAILGWRTARPAFDVLSITPRHRGIPIPIRRLVMAARRHGVPTQVWTVNDPSDAQRYWDYGVAAILTDDTAVIAAVRGR